MPNVVTKLSVTGAAQTTRALHGVSAAMRGMGVAAAATNKATGALGAGVALFGSALRAATFGIGLAGGAIAGIGVLAVKAAGDFQTLQARLNAVYGSAKEGEAAFAWAKKFAKETPFELKEVIDAMTDMKALGLDATRDLRTLGDTASALGLGAEGVSRITLQLGQMKAAGKATLMDLRPLMQAGVPVLDILKEQLGLTEEQLANIGETGVSATATIDALMNGLDKRFAGGMRIHMETLAGKVSNLKDQFTELLVRMGSALIPFVTQLTQWLTDQLANPKLIDWVMSFTSKLAAGLEAAGKLAGRVMAVLFDKQKMEVFFHVFMAKLQLVKAAVLDAFLFMQTIKLGVASIEALGKGNMPAALLMATVGLLLANLGRDQTSGALAAHDMEMGMAYRAANPGSRLTDPEIAKGLKAGTLKISLLGGESFLQGLRVSDVQARARELEGKWKAGDFGLPRLELKKNALGGAGSRPIDLSSILKTTAEKAASGVAAAMDRIVLWGGGSRAREVNPWMDIGRGLRRRNPEINVTVRVRPATNKAMDRAVAEVAEDTTNQTLAALLRDPRALSQLKAALA